MADLVCVATGNLTAAATWGQTMGTSGAANPKLISSSLGTTTLTTSQQGSTDFTPTANAIIGVCVRLTSRATGSPTNTITITLRNTTTAADAATVTANVSDLPVCSTGAESEGGWHFFKFSASHTPNGTDTYEIRAILSSTSTAVSLATDGTAANWQRILVLDTTAAPAAGDDLYLAQTLDGAASPATVTARTVTMDQTAATDYGSGLTSSYTPTLSVSKACTLAYANAAATNYILRESGIVVVFSAGTFTIGTSGARIAIDGSAELQFDSAADAQFGLIVRNGGTFQAFGRERTSGKLIFGTTLNTDEAAASTSLGVADDTGWLNGDEIGIAATARVFSEYETRTLNADAGASSLSISAGLTNAHLGSGDYFAEVVLLTRNVRILAVTSTLTAFTNFKPGSFVSCEWTMFRYMAGSVTVGKRGIEIETSLSASSGTLTLRYCLARDSEGEGFRILGTSNGWTIQDTVVYNSPVPSGGINTYAIFVEGGSAFQSWTLENVWIIGATGPGSTGGGLNLGSQFGTINNLRISSCRTVGFNFLSTGFYTTAPTFGGTWHLHSCEGVLLNLAASLDGVSFPVMHLWRCPVSAIRVNASVFLNNVSFGAEGTESRWVGNGVGSSQPDVSFLSPNGSNDVRWLNIALAADDSFAADYGLLIDRGQQAHMNWLFRNCAWSQTAGTRAAFAVADLGIIYSIAAAPGGSGGFQAFAYNCLFNGPGVVWDRVGRFAWLRSVLHNQTAGLYKTLTPLGDLTIETTTVDVSPSLKMQPKGGAAVAFDSAAKVPGGGFCVPVLSGQTVSVTVKVQKDASYNGSTEPQLVLLADSQLGIAADSVLDTLTVGSGTFETLSGTTPAASANGVFEFIVRGYGTAGAVFADTWTAS